MGKELCVPTELLVLPKVSHWFLFALTGRGPVSAAKWLAMILLTSRSSGVPVPSSRKRLRGTVPPTDDSVIRITGYPFGSGFPQITLKKRWAYMAQLELGQVVMTQGVAALIEKDVAFAKHVLDSMQRYTRHDWGDLCDEDIEMNNSALGPDADRILAAYEMENQPEQKIWIITEWDRSVTTILFPDEY